MGTLNYEGSGIYISDTENGLFHNASIHFLGAFHAVKGAFEESGGMVLTAPDGDKAFVTYKGSGNLGKDAKGTYTYVGGTGKYTGITGGGEFTRSSNWKLP
jgi:hypothetical protein